MAAINHDASRFLTLVAQQFDVRHFPNEPSLPVYKEEGGTLFTELTFMTVLPTEMQAEIHARTKNFAHWIQSTRYLEPPLENATLEDVRKRAIETSARELLVKLNRPLGYTQSYSEQLLTYVFQDAFNRVEADERVDERENIIELAARLQPVLDNLPFTFRRVKYKVEFTVSKILNHFVAKIALTYIAFRIARWIQPQIYRLLFQSMIPRGANYLTNHAHIAVIYVVSGTVALVQFAYIHYWKASIVFYTAKYVSGKLHPRLQEGVIIIETFAFFPGRVIRWLVMGPISLFTSTWQMHSSLAASLNASKDRSRVLILEEGGMNAHRAWMELMQSGIKAHLVPSQPIEVVAV